MHFEIASESGIIVYFSETISQQTASCVAAVYAHLETEKPGFICDLIPSYTSLLVIYDCTEIDALGCMHWLKAELTSEVVDDRSEVSSASVEIPVYYGPEVAFDLAEVSQQTGLEESEVVRRHANGVYQVYSIGFAPGFAYLGLTEPCLRVDRKMTPRLKVPKGSVALADNQTAVYPSVSPGGWQVIGRTPIELVDWRSSAISPFTMGGQVKFRAISRDEYLQLGGDFDGL